MTRSFYRRAVVLVALLCQVATAAAVHLPMAKMPAQSQETAAAGHCADHASAAQSPPAAPQSQLTHHEPDPGAHHDGACKSGLCNCACAHAPASAIAVALAPSTSTVHPPGSQFISLPVPLDRAKSFFRPPI